MTSIAYWKNKDHLEELQQLLDTGVCENLSLLIITTQDVVMIERYKGKEEHYSYEEEPPRDKIEYYIVLRSGLEIHLTFIIDNGQPVLCYHDYRLMNRTSADY